jgi:hypothetical protein
LEGIEVKDEKKAELKETILTLKDWGVKVVTHSNEPDRQRFGNWFVVGIYHYVAVRFVCDRDHIGLDLMPAALYKPEPLTPGEGNSESEWYTWDVVSTALGIKFKLGPDPLAWFYENRSRINDAFGPVIWERTRKWLADVEEEKRRRFTQGRDVPARDPVPH